jgi:hypothetical protein
LGEAFEEGQDPQMAVELLSTMMMMMMMMMTRKIFGSIKDERRNLLAYILISLL